MKKYNQGFIALFFTLGISSILMAYVAISSEKVFEYVHSKENFLHIRDSMKADFNCADQYVNVVIETYSLPTTFTACTVTHAHMMRIDSETLEFSFIIRNRQFKGTIYQGLISKLQTFTISL